MLLILLALAGIGIGIGRLLRLPLPMSFSLGAFLSLLVLVAINAPLVGEARSYEKLCASDTEYAVRQIVSDVEAIQIRGDSGGLWNNPGDLKYMQVYGAPSSDRAEDRLPVRYEVRVSRTQISKRTSRIEQSVIDLESGKTLGTSKSYEFNGRVTGEGLSAIFLMPWWLPSLPFAPNRPSCPDSRAAQFVQTVLVPRQ